MLPESNDVKSSDAPLTAKTQQQKRRLIDYAATYPNIYIIFYASEMVLNIKTDVSYLVLPNIISRT